MSAGSGIVHSEFNASQNQAVEFLQIWIQPKVINSAPSYQQRHFQPPHNEFATVVAPLGSALPHADNLHIKQDMRLMFGRFAAGLQKTQHILSHRRYWLHLIHGELEINGQSAVSGDSFAINSCSQFDLRVASNTDVLLFDLP